MFVLLMDQQAISSDVVCRGCLLANQQGQPRWQEGQLLCGRPLQGSGTSVSNLPEASAHQLSTQYECQMGFRVTRLNDTL